MAEATISRFGTPIPSDWYGSLARRPGRRLREGTFEAEIYRRLEVSVVADAMNTGTPLILVADEIMVHCPVSGSG